MTISFNLLGYTFASIDVDLGAPLGKPPTALMVASAQHRPPIVNTMVKGMSDWWVGRMMAR
jgi:hypothetical protein